MLRKNKTLFKLLLNGAMLDDADGALILGAIENHPTLDLIDLIRNDLGRESSLKIASLVQNNRVLKEYYFRDNQLDAQAISLAISNMEDNYVITYFDVQGNAGITEEAVSRVSELLARNREKEKEAFAKAMQMKSSSKAGWHRSKVMVVGQGRAGKTATVNSLQGKTFDANWDSTIGINQTEVVANQNDRWRPAKKTEKGDNALKFAAMVAAKQIREQKGPRKSNSRRSLWSLASQVKGGLREEEKSQQGEVLNPTNVAGEGGARGEGERGGEGGTRGVEGERGGEVEHAQEDEGTAEFMKDYKHDLVVKAQIRRDAITVSVWDYGGQKVFYTLHQLFLTEYGIYLLVFSIPHLLKKPQESLEYLNLWINSIHLHAPQAPVIIAGTSLCSMEQGGMEKLNLLFEEANVNRFDQVDINAESRQPFYCIDNKYDVGVKGLRSRVEELIKRQDHVNFQVSIKWMHCLDKINETSRAWLPIGQVTDIAEQCFITNARELEQMLHLFHQLGVIVHFTKTQALADVVTIQPQWLVDEISKVIRDPSIHKFDASEMASVGLEPDIKRLFEAGIASEDLIDYLWARQSKDFLLDLMRSLLLLSDWDFDTTLSEGNKYYLVPSMVSAARSSTELSGLKAVFDFSHFFLPDGMFERLVCLLVQHSAHLPGSKTPVLTQSSCTIWLGAKDVVCLAKTEHAIELYILRSDIAPKVLPVVRSMLRKLQEEAMGKGLTWKSLLEVEGHMVPYEEAKSAAAKPWFSETIKPAAKPVPVEEFEGL